MLALISHGILLSRDHTFIFADILNLNCFPESYKYKHEQGAKVSKLSPGQQYKLPSRVAVGCQAAWAASERSTEPPQQNGMS